MGALDQGVTLTDNELAIFRTVDNVVEQAVIAGDPTPAFEFANDLLRQGQVRGLALAKFLYLMKTKWNMFQAAGTEDNFEDVVFASTGRSPETATKYINMWYSIFENKDLSKEIKIQLMGRPIGDLLLMTATVREGVDDRTLQELVAAPDKIAIQDIVKRERGERTSSKTAVRIFLQRRAGSQIPEGSLYLRRGADTHIFGGLDITDEDADVQKAIARIINSSNISEAN